MKRISIFMLVLIFTSSVLFAGVTKKTKSEVTFKGFGTYTLVQTEKIAADKKHVESENDFKGKGLMGGLAGKLLFKSANEGELVDLSEMTVYRMDHKNKQYHKVPLLQLSQQDMSSEEIGEQEDVKDEEEQSDIRIIRSEFKVEKTGESKTINKFSCDKYLVTWITEWENVNTGEKGTERLTTDVWTTPLSGDLQAAHEEEMAFSKAYMEKIGLDMDEVQKSILGTNWLTMFSALNQRQTQPDQESAQVAEEMKKIEGYPVVVDGKYFSEREGEEKQEQESQDITDVKNMFGGFVKKAIKKDKKKENEPSFAYYTELIELQKSSVDASALKVPENYKLKE